ncbi:unnamed protein product [Amoebophrya sp. A25]|nr:unnamed protein product [Amoebophrya sp. A25]|eukprot:GSA25T00021782001.1
MTRSLNIYHNSPVLRKAAKLMLQQRRRSSRPTWNKYSMLTHTRTLTEHVLAAKYSVVCAMRFCETRGCGLLAVVEEEWCPPILVAHYKSDARPAIMML